MAQTINQNVPPTNKKSKIVAGILALILGTFGIHKFYLEKFGNGVMYLLFCWTGIPTLFGLVECIMYLSESDEEFQERVKYM